MIERYSLNAYWGPRREDAKECARHMLDCLTCLAGLDSSLQIWYEKAKSLNEALQHKVLLDLTSLEQFLLKGKSYTDFERRPMEELGYSVSFWNGQDSEEGIRRG